MPSSSQEGVIIRHATRKDVPVILQLIQELADYEKELSSVEATEESLLATLSFAASPSKDSISTQESDIQSQVLEPISPQRTVRALLIFPPSSQKAVGLALYYHTYSTWRAKPGIYLEDLYVQPSQRGKGYGKKLIEELAKLVVKIEGGRLEWSVLRWNKPSIDFYEKIIGATEMSEWMGMRVDGDALKKLASA